MIALEKGAQDRNEGNVLVSKLVVRFFKKKRVLQKGFKQMCNKAVSVRKKTVEDLFFHF